ncbi:hypothetical protein V2J56_07510 [Georgenia sp. MJ206]|uniref:hypothetical protein n=1 Tax=Georgenia wangjunii TaxID=3117730 RepID=UPI002F26C7DA
MFAIVGERASAHYVPEEFIDGKDRIVVIGRAEITPVVNGRTWTVRELRAYRDWNSFPTSATCFIALGPVPGQARSRRPGCRSHIGCPRHCVWLSFGLRCPGRR